MFEPERQDQEMSEAWQVAQKPERQDATRDTDFCASWAYTPDEWRHFDRIDWGSALRKELRALCLLMIPAALISGFVSIILNQVMPAFKFDVFLLCTVLFSFFIPLLVPWFLFFAPPLWQARQRYKARRHAEPRVIIGVRDPSNNEQNIWLGGQRFPLLGMFLELDQASLTLDPPVLHLRIKHLPRDLQSDSFWYETFHILIPRTHEGEAQMLLERFQREAISQ